MNDLTYYTKAINDCRETQCQSDLLNGKSRLQMCHSHSEATTNTQLHTNMQEDLWTRKRDITYIGKLLNVWNLTWSTCKQQLTLKTVEYQIASQHLTFLKNPDISIWTTEPLN